jgi:hypothetical protein
MVAFIGLTHKVPSIVDNGRHGIMVFEGNQEIRSDLLNWLQSRQTSGVSMRTTTRSSVRDADEGAGTSLKPSNTSEDSPISPPIGNEVASDLDPIAGAVEGNTMDWICMRSYQEAILHCMFEQETQWFKELPRRTIPHPQCIVEENYRS